MQRAAQQAQAVGQHAGDRAGAVAELHGLAVAVRGGGGHAQVAGGGQPHADEADRPAEQRADQEGAGAAEGERQWLRTSSRTGATVMMTISGPILRNWAAR